MAGVLGMILAGGEGHAFVLLQNLVVNPRFLLAAVTVLSTSL